MATRTVPAAAEPQAPETERQETSVMVRQLRWEAAGVVSVLPARPHGGRLLPCYVWLRWSVPSRAKWRSAGNWTRAAESPRERGTANGERRANAKRPVRLGDTALPPLLVGIPFPSRLMANCC